MSTEFATAVALHAFASVPFKKTSLGGPMLTVQVMLLVKSILSLTIRWRASEEIGAAEEYRSGRRVSTLDKEQLIGVVYGFKAWRSNKKQQGPSYRFYGAKKLVKTEELHLRRWSCKRRSRELSWKLPRQWRTNKQSRETVGWTARITRREVWLV
jgi:hypothetical protein